MSDFYFQSKGVGCSSLFDNKKRGLWESGKVEVVHLDMGLEIVKYGARISADGSGSDVLSLQQHLAKRDASLDATSFAYLYTLLCQHPSILISISTYPLPSADRTIQLGTAPLPADYAPPDEAREVDFDRLYREGKRGRELAFHLAGEEHLTSRQAVEAKRQEQERIRLEKLTGRFYEVEQAASKGKKKGWKV